LRVFDEAIQIHGEIGFMRAINLERIVQDFRIFEGANDILRLFIGLHLCELRKSSSTF